MRYYSTSIQLAALFSLICVSFSAYGDWISELSLVTLSNLNWNLTMKGMKGKKKVDAQAYSGHTMGI